MVNVSTKLISKQILSHHRLERMNLQYFESRTDVTIRTRDRSVCRRGKLFVGHANHEKHMINKTQSKICQLKLTKGNVSIVKKKKKVSFGVIPALVTYR